MDYNEFGLIILCKLFLVAIVIDFITGVLVAMREHRLKSRTCSNGMFRSLGEVMVLLSFVLVNHLIPATHDYLTVFMIGFLFKEGISVCENLIKLDVWVPSVIKKGLEVGADKIDNGQFITKK